MVAIQMFKLLQEVAVCTDCYKGSDGPQAPRQRRHVFQR